MDNISDIQGRDKKNGAGPRPVQDWDLKGVLSGKWTDSPVFELVGYLWGTCGVD